MMWLKYLLFWFGSRSFQKFGIEANKCRNGVMVIEYPWLFGKDWRFDAVIEALGDSIVQVGGYYYKSYHAKIKSYDLFKMCVRINQMKVFS